MYHDDWSRADWLLHGDEVTVEDVDVALEDLQQSGSPDPTWRGRLEARKAQLKRDQATAQTDQQEQIEA